MNKVETAIRITHLPTGIVVQCQNERSQLQNRNGAMKILKSRLYEVEQKKKEAEFNAIVGEKKDIAWGSQIRSYVFQPYQMVKDHRTGYEVGQVAAVMDGDVDGFIEAYLKKQLTKGSAAAVTGPGAGRPVSAEYDEDVSVMDEAERTAAATDQETRPPAGGRRCAVRHAVRCEGPGGRSIRLHGQKTKETLEQENISCTVAGRIVALRRFGKAAFAVLQDGSERLQTYLKKDFSPRRHTP